MSYVEQTNVGHDEKDGQVGRPGFEPGTYAVSERDSPESCCPNQTRRPALFLGIELSNMGL